MTMNISSVGTTAGYTTNTRGNTSPTRENQQAQVDGNDIEASIKPDVSMRQKAIDRALEELQEANTIVERSIHEGTNHIVYKIKDKVSGDVIREIPEEKLLDMAAKLMELNGMVIDKKV